MSFTNIDEWLDSILLENVPMMSQETKSSYSSLMQNLTNMSISERLPLKMQKNSTTSYIRQQSTCQSSKSKIIVKTTRQPSRLGRFLCHKSKRDDVFQSWLDNLIFPHPVSFNFPDMCLSDRVIPKKIKKVNSIRLYKRIPKNDNYLINNNCRPISWNELDTMIHRRTRYIDDDIYDGNKKATLIRVLNTHDFNLLNGGSKSVLLPIFLSLMHIGSIS